MRRSQIRFSEKKRAKTKKVANGKVADAAMKYVGFVVAGVSDFERLVWKLQRRADVLRFYRLEKA